MTKQRKGFTLIELLVVISIIALLISILLPALRKARDTSRFVKCQVNQRSIAQGVYSYATDEDGQFPPSIACDLAYTPPFWSRPSRISYHPDFLGGQGGGGGWLGKMLRHYQAGTDAFFCPMTQQMPDPAVLKAAWNGYGGSSWIQDVSYNLLWNYDGFSTQTPPFIPASRLRDITSRTLLTTDGLSWNDGQPGVILSPHPFNGATIVSSGRTDYRYIASDPNRHLLPKSHMLNSAYADGHVETFMYKDTVDYHPGIAGSHPAVFMLPNPEQ